MRFKTQVLTASKKYCENLTASRVAEVTINFMSGLFLTHYKRKPQIMNHGDKDMKY